MPPDRLRSIVPMFGGGTRYVETLDAVLEFVTDHQPTTDELAGVASRFVFECVESGVDHAAGDVSAAGRVRTRKE